MSTQHDGRVLHVGTLTERCRGTRALLAIMLVIAFGTFGFVWIEGWDLWRSLFFTLITITTVGYGDYGLSDAGERFTTILLIGGIAVATYSVGQLLQAVVEFNLAWERKMLKKIQRLSDHYIICGLGRFGLAVCDRLRDAGIPVVGLDRSEQSVEDLVEHGHLAFVGDATEDEVLLKVGIARAKGIVCVTGSDPDNIVITLTARDLNPDLYIVSRAEEESGIRKIQRAGASRVISPIRTGGEQIADSILRPHVAAFLAEARESESAVELVELPVDRDSKLDGSRIGDYVTKNPALVFVAILPAGGSLTIPPDIDATLVDGDVLIVAGDPLAVGRLRDDSRSLRQAA